MLQFRYTGRSNSRRSTLGGEMTHRFALLGLGLAFVALAAGCGVSAAQEDTSGDAATAGDGSSENRGTHRISETNSPVFGTSYVSPLVELYGDVFIGERSFVAGNTVLRAAPDRRLEIGDETNSQDNVIARALKGDSVIGDETSLAHHALICDSEIGDFAFVGL